jgi:membrane-associated progesterone receptor component
MFKAGDTLENRATPLKTPFSALQLSQHDGSDPSKPVFLCVKGIIYDVSKSIGMYGPEGSYHNFAGKDASRALGMSSTKIEHCLADYSTLGEEELKVLDDWEKLYQRKV